MSDEKNDYFEDIRYIGLRIAYFRKIKNMTQKTLAEKVHINKHYLSHIERGSLNKTLSLPLLIKIAKALDVELSLLVDQTDLERSKNEIHSQFNEMKMMFEEMKQFSDELDKFMLEIEHLD